jgi:2-(1,2-epoxy-1,2-dihydrophenyl)acetyl-CoA isomerase
MTTLDTGTDDLLAETADGVAVLTMNRPSRRNALSREMVQALARVLADVEADDGVGAVVLTGAGGAFCAGGDVKAMAEGYGGLSLEERGDLQRSNQRATVGRLHRMAKPTLAALPGPAAGAGLGLALACDLRYAAETAVLTTAFAKVGLAGDYGVAWSLTRLVGTSRARELLWLAERLTAARAAELGLVNAVLPADSDVVAETVGLARRLAQGPRVALAGMKDNLDRAILGDLEDCMDVEVANHLRTVATEDHAEAAQAFVAKREPVFRGR